MSWYRSWVDRSRVDSTDSEHWIDESVQELGGQWLWALARETGSESVQE